MIRCFLACFPLHRDYKKLPNQKTEFQNTNILSWIFSVNRHTSTTSLNIFIQSPCIEDQVEHHVFLFQPHKHARFSLKAINILPALPFGECL